MQTLFLTIRRGETVNIPIRVESDVLAYKAITSIAKAGPARLVVAGHGLADGWRAAVANAQGMSEINFARSEEGRPPRDKDLRPVTVIDANTIEFNGINSAGFGAHTADTGHLVFYAPADLSLYAGARMEVKDAVDGTRLALFATPSTVADATNGELELDDTNNALRLRTTDEESALLDFDEGVFDIELLTAGGDVTPICTADSVLTVLPEVTTAD